jgi:hypothetical protein
MSGIGSSPEDTRQRRRAMASPKRTTKTKPAGKKKAAAVAAAPARRPPGRPKGSGMVTRPVVAKGAAKAKGPISPVTGLPVREKIHLPIKGFGRLNGFGVLENLFGKTPAELKQILAYEEKHQARRMVIDRIHDMLKRAGVK